MRREGSHLTESRLNSVQLELEFMTSSDRIHPSPPYRLASRRASSPAQLQLNCSSSISPCLIPSPPLSLTMFPSPHIVNKYRSHSFINERNNEASVAVNERGLHKYSVFPIASFRLSPRPIFTHFSTVHIPPPPLSLPYCPFDKNTH